MTDTMLTRMARAVWGEAYDDYADDAEFVADALQDARAVIAAMMELTEAMIDAAYRAEPVPPMRAHRQHYRAGLLAALQAILDEKQP